MKHYKSVDFLSNFRMSVPCTNAVSQLKTFWWWFCCNEQRQGITLYMCNWKRSNTTARPSAHVTMKTASKCISTITCLNYFFKMGPYTYRGLRASAHRVNIWSLLYILRGLNHYWIVKWTMKRSLHHWDHIIRLII